MQIHYLEHQKKLNFQLREMEKRMKELIRAKKDGSDDDLSSDKTSSEQTS